MTRPTMIEVYMDFARGLAKRSTCKRLTQVGCIITTPDLSGGHISIGYNGPSRGLPNDSCTGEPGGCGCVHAETNAIAKAPYDRGPLIMITTHSPCETCARLILNTRVRTIVYAEEYRDTSPLRFFRTGPGVWTYEDCMKAEAFADENDGLPIACSLDTWLEFTRR